MPGDSLKIYRAKRNFEVTSEPAEGGESNEEQPVFVIQKHWASRLHYDLRLELDGAMKSWAVPKGPSYDPHDKRMAVQVEDHPIAYNQFEGEIPKGEYGAGKVIIWDEGTWTPLEDPRKGWRDGMLKFELHGRKMLGKWALIRIKSRGSEKQPPWLLIKEKDAYTKPASEFSVVDELPDSVVPLRDAKPPSGKAAAKAAPKKAAPKKAAPKKAAKATEPTKSAKPAPSAKTAKSKSEAAGAAEASTGNTTRQRGSTAGLPGQAAELPAALKPQLATLVEGVPGNPKDWLFEIKYDGYRLLARIEGKEVKLFTRNGHDWTHKLTHLAKALQKLKLKSGWLDGEIVVVDDKGVPNFQLLQNAFDSSRTGSIVFYLFDAPFLNGRDLRQEPLETRRELLRGLFEAGAPDELRFSETFDARPQDLVASACRMGLEGVIGKLKSSPYVTRRADSWVKLKCSQRQEFVIGGYTDPKGGRVGLGSLLLGVHDESGKLRYAGNVGTGFDDRTLVELKSKIDAVAADASPFDGPTQHDRKAHWAKPVLLAEVSFGEWTGTGQIRHSVFRGLRTDKKPVAITRDRPKKVEDDMEATKTPSKSRSKSKSAAGSTDTAAAKPESASGRSPARKGSSAAAKSASAAPAGKAGLQVNVTNPERVIDPSTGLTKLDLVRYYGLVAPLLLEHLKGRPVSLVRAPSGIKGQLFFQKHLESKMPGVKSLDASLDPDHPPYLEVPTAAAVLSAAQMNVVEFHTWNAIKTAIDKPDRMTFDLDPGEGIDWKAMQQAASLMRGFLEQLGLESFLKTSGGKGLHVVVPLKKQHGWDTVKSFSQAIVQHVARTLPQLFVAKSGPSNRIGKIFVDYLRNGFGATTASAWSARARPGLGVSVPVRWDELDGLKSGSQWTVANIHERLDQGNAPWDGYAPQPIARAMKALDFKP